MRLSCDNSKQSEWRRPQKGCSFKDTEDAEFIDEMMNVLGDEVKEVDSFLIVYKYKDRFTKPFKRTLAMITKMFGNFWSKTVLVVNFWSFKKTHVQVGRPILAM